MGQILVPGTWGQGVPGTADKGPTWASYRGAFQAGYSLAPLAPLSWLEGVTLEGGVLNFPNSQEEKAHLGRGRGLPASLGRQILTEKLLQSAMGGRAGVHRRSYPVSHLTFLWELRRSLGPGYWGHSGGLLQRPKDQGRAVLLIDNGPVWPLPHPHPTREASWGTKAILSSHRG